MGVDVKVKDLSIKTFSVELKAIRVSGKQMTISVFRQLPYVQLNSSSVLEDATIWGWVEHCYLSCRDYGPHRHLVFEKHGRLFTTRVGLDGFVEWSGPWKDFTKGVNDTMDKLGQLFIAV